MIDVHLNIIIKVIICLYTLINYKLHDTIIEHNDTYLLLQLKHLKIHL